MTERLAILIPTLNEAAGIGVTIDSLPMQELREAGVEPAVWVVDGGSSDGTQEIAQGRGATVIVQIGHGKGQGVRQAVAAIDADWIAMLDGDASYPGDALPRLLHRARRGADAVMGNRFGGTMAPGAMSRTNRFGNQMLSALASILYGRVADVCTGMWVFRKAALDSLPLRADGFEIEVELFALASRLGLVITPEVIDYFDRAGESKLGGIRTGLRIGWHIVALRFQRLRR